MLFGKIRYSVLSRVTSAFLIHAFLLSNIALAAPVASNPKYSLARYTATRDYKVNREMYAAMYRKSGFVWGIKPGTRYDRDLERLHARGFLFDSGRFAVPDKLKKVANPENDLLLVRICGHENFEVLMQKEEQKMLRAQYPRRTKYHKLREQVLNDETLLKAYYEQLPKEQRNLIAEARQGESLLPALLSTTITRFSLKNKKNRTKEDRARSILFNDLIACAFELAFIIDEPLVDPDTELTDKERKFIGLMRPVLEAKDSRGRYKNFSKVFFDFKKRAKLVRSLQEEENERFYRVTNAKKPQDFRGDSGNLPNAKQIYNELATMQTHTERVQYLSALSGVEVPINEIYALTASSGLTEDFLDRINVKFASSIPGLKIEREHLIQGMPFASLNLKEILRTAIEAKIHDLQKGRISGIQEAYQDANIRVNAVAEIADMKNDLRDSLSKFLTYALTQIQPEEKISIETITQEVVVKFRIITSHGIDWDEERLQLEDEISFIKRLGGYFGVEKAEDSNAFTIYFPKKGTNVRILKTREWMENDEIEKVSHRYTEPREGEDRDYEGISPSSLITLLTKEKPYEIFEKKIGLELPWFKYLLDYPPVWAGDPSKLSGEEAMILGPAYRWEEIMGLILAFPDLKAIHIVDIDPSGLAYIDYHLQHYLPSKVRPEIYTYVMNFLELPEYLTGRIKFVYDAGVFDHAFFSPRQLAQVKGQVYKVLKPGGIHASRGSKTCRISFYGAPFPMVPLHNIYVVDTISIHQRFSDTLTVGRRDKLAYLWFGIRAMRQGNIKDAIGHFKNAIRFGIPLADIHSELNAHVADDPTAVDEALAALSPPKKTAAVHENKAAMETVAGRVEQTVVLTGQNNGEVIGRLQQGLRDGQRMILEAGHIRYRILSLIAKRDDASVFKVRRLEDKVKEPTALKIITDDSRVRYRDMEEFFAKLKTNGDQRAQKLFAELIRTEPKLGMLEKAYVEGESLEDISDKHRRFKIMVNLTRELAYVNDRYKIFGLDLWENNIEVNMSDVPVLFDYDELIIYRGKAQKIDRVRMLVKYYDIANIGAMLANIYGIDCTADSFCVDCEASAEMITDEEIRREIEDMPPIVPPEDVPEDIVRIVRKALFADIYNGEYYRSLQELYDDLKSTADFAKLEAQDSSQTGHISSASSELAQQAFDALNAEAKQVPQLNSEISKLRGTSQELMDVTKFRFCVPMNVLRESADIALALGADSIGLLKRESKDTKNIKFELVITGVKTDKDVELVDKLRDDVDTNGAIKKALRLPDKFTIDMKTEAQIEDRIEHNKLYKGYDITDPWHRAVVVKGFYTGLGDGAYTAIATDAVKTEKDADRLQAEIEKGFASELARENVSIRVLVKPENSASMFSISKIINDWLEAIGQGDLSTISKISPVPAPITEGLREVMEEAWAVLRKA